MQSSPTPFGAPPRSPTLVLILLLIVLLAALAFGIYFITAVPIELQIGSEHYTLRTHETTVRAVLVEAGVYLEPEDVVAPTLDAPLSAGLTIIVTKARPVIVAADGNEVRLLTHLTDPKAILAEAGVVVLANDKISSDGSTVSVQRSRSVTLDDNGTQRILYTSGTTVAAALDESRISLFSADQVTPPLNQMLTDDARITIKRSIPITVQVDGRTLRTRTHAQTVSEALAGVGIALNGMDTSTPPGTTAIGPNLAITVKRITETEEVEQAELPFNRVLTPDPALELDQIVITQAGQVGIQEIHTRVRREDGVEISRSAPLRWIVTPARNEQGKIGMKPTLHTLETPDTKVSYWRKFTVRATAYRPATSGKLPNDPLYGVTSTGQRLAKGIVAVDPDLIPIGTELYIPGYGRAVAGDVPGNLIGLQIKLGYDDSDYIPFAGKTTVYLLAPIPPIEKIAQLPLPEN